MLNVSCVEVTVYKQPTDVCVCVCVDQAMYQYDLVCRNCI